jgi:LmbE family N-acetylglucosaminyl deacetylase
MRQVRVLISFLLVAVWWSPGTGLGGGFPPKNRNAAELLLALQRLTVLGSVLYVGAHPDDENTALLAYLAKGRGVRTAYLSITRGDGGQNLLGPERDAYLGVLRTQELLAARRVDGAEQFFTRAIDFGYSKSLEETLRVWGHDAVLADVVWVFRKFRPDVVITRFPKTGGGHGHHTASAILAEEAFQAAGDPNRFPEQLQYVRPWRPRRLLWNMFRPAEGSLPPAGTLILNVGAYNALLGRSYTEIAAESRSLHKSQGFGSAARRGEVLEFLVPLAGDPPEKDLLDGIDTTWNRVPGGAAVGAVLAEAVRAFRPDRPSDVVPLLLEAYERLHRLPSDEWVDVKRRELLDVLRDCAGLWAEAVASDETAAPGTEVHLNLTALLPSDLPWILEKVRWPYRAEDLEVRRPLRPGRPVQVEASFRVPEDASPTHPYWLREPPVGGLYPAADPDLQGQPEDSPLKVEFVVSTGRVPLVFSVPVVYRYTDPLEGEQYRPWVIVPPVSVHWDDAVYIFPDDRPKRVRLVLQGHAAGVAGTLRLHLPPGWQAEPLSVPFRMGQKGETMETFVTIRPPAKPATGWVRADVEIGNRRRPARDIVRIAYPHILPQTLSPPAEARLVRVDLTVRKRHIGYVMGSGDEIPRYLRQLGYRVVLLTDEDLEAGDLRPLESIITGVRAYNTRPVLRRVHRRLMDYVAGGGTLVVQYNTARGLVTDAIGPYPFQIAADRVTIEDAPVMFLRPDHPVLNHPHRLTDRDFEGWVQERGLYFAGTWDPRYETVLASQDPGEKPLAGGLLWTRYGKGIFVYTAYAWFRQLPAGVPGAYRAFVNLIEAR